jgi:hypothetical protein
MCDGPSMAVFCKESIECCPGIVSRYFCKLLLTIPVTPMMMIIIITIIKINIIIIIIIIIIIPCHRFYFIIIIITITITITTTTTTIKSDRQHWLKFVGDSLRNNPHHFWKYVSNFRRKYNSFIQLKVDNQYVTDPKLIADAFANHFASTFNANIQSFIPSDLIASDILPTAPISAAEVSKAVKRLRPSKC